MAIIRLAIIGLSASAKTSWAAEGHLPYLLSPRGRERYEIAALLNSSVAAAEAARQAFDLPSTVKAYGSPADVAADPNIDLVVCCTRVDVHFSVTAPIVAAGKPVFIEWPLVEDVARAEELLALYASKEAARDSIIGFQGRLAPPVLKLKEVLASGAIGKILSSDIRAFANLTQRDAYPLGLEYFADRSVGGSPATIAYAHMIDFVHDVVGDFASEGVVTRTQIQRPAVSVLSGGKSIKTITSDVPDLISISGPLADGTAANPAVRSVPGATLAVSFRNGSAFPGTPNFSWTINGERGEIRATGISGPFLHSDSYDEPPVLELHDHASDTVKQIEWDWEGWQSKLPIRTRIVAQLYERYAAWNGDRQALDRKRDEKTGLLPHDSRWPTLLDALHRQKEIGRVFESWDEQRKKEANL